MIDWFKFDHDARDDIEIKELEFDLGPEGFGIFMFLVLALANSENGKLPTKFVFSDIYRYSKSPQTKAKVEKINRVLRNYGLFKFETDEKGNEIFYSTRMLTNMEKVDKKSEDCSKAAKAKAEKEKAEKEKKICGCSADASPSKDLDLDIDLDKESKENTTKEKRNSEEVERIEKNYPNLIGNEVFYKKWQDWKKQYPKNHYGKEITYLEANSQLSILNSLSAEDAIYSLERAIAGSWKNINPQQKPRENKKPQKHTVNSAVNGVISGLMAAAQRQANEREASEC